RPGQPVVRLRACPGPADGRALRRRRPVRRVHRTGLGADVRVRPGPVGTADHPRLPRHHPVLGPAAGHLHGPARRRHRTDRQPPAGPAEGHVMTLTILRTSEHWWVENPHGRAAQIPTAATTTAELLADRKAISQAKGEVPVAELDLVSPVTAPCRVVAQMVNYQSHARDSGINPDIV